MNETIKQVTNRHLSNDYTPAEIYGEKQAEKVRAYHESFAEYHPTELTKAAGSDLTPSKGWAEATASADTWRRNAGSRRVS